VIVSLKKFSEQALEIRDMLKYREKDPKKLILLENFRRFNLIAR